MSELKERELRAQRFSVGFLPIDRPMVQLKTAPDTQTSIWKPVIQPWKNGIWRQHFACADASREKLFERSESLSDSQRCTPIARLFWVDSTKSRPFSPAQGLSPKIFPPVSVTEHLPRSNLPP